MGWTAIAHVILGMDRDEPQFVRRAAQVLVMRALEANADRIWKLCYVASPSGLDGLPRDLDPPRGVRGGYAGRSRSNAVSDPMRSVPSSAVGTAIFLQLPAGTRDHVFPWQSTVDVPTQVVPGPAAWPFSPAGATP